MRKRLPTLPPVEECTTGTPLWAPTEKMKEQSNIKRYMDWLEEHYELTFDSYNELWEWSIEELPTFWKTMYEYFRFDSPYEDVLTKFQMPGVEWFTGARVNYAEHILRDAKDSSIAVYSKSETRTDRVRTWQELRTDVMKLATYFRTLGVKKGERVVAYMPNIYESVVAMLATAAIGAVWSSTAPEFGSASVIDRFAQIEPTVFITVGGYRHHGELYDRRDEVNDMIAQLPTLKHVIFVPYAFAAPDTPKLHLWPEIMHQVEVDEETFIFEPVEFNEPLWILYSSGTTGIPKAIVHSHGGVLIEMYKLTTFHLDLREGDTMFFYTTTGWMMFNLLVSGLLTKSSIVLYDGSPTYPDTYKLWEIVDQTNATMFGSSPAYIQQMRRAEIVPGEQFKLRSLRSMLLSGSPASAEVFHWIYSNVKRDLWLTSQSGGTDVCSGFIGAIPTEPVRAGEIQVRMLGVGAQAYDELGHRVVEEVGELVITDPMPSMPIYLWNDPEKELYRETYFSMFPKVWQHGDYVEFHEDGSSIVYGRSDSILNRNGVRIGTGEIYTAIEKSPYVKDSLVVHIELPTGESFMPLFVVVQEGMRWSDSTSDELKEVIRKKFTKRHVPDAVYAVHAIPYTLTMKKMEVPVRRLLQGEPLEEVASLEAMHNPEAMEDYTEFYETVMKPMIENL